MNYRIKSSEIPTALIENFDYINHMLKFGLPVDLATGRIRQITVSYQDGSNIQITKEP